MTFVTPLLDFSQFKKIKLLKKFKYYHTNKVFEEVYKVQEKNTGRMCLAYISHPEEVKKNSKSLNRVVNILSNLQEHKAILNYIGYSKFTQNGSSYSAIITEYCSNCSLKDIILAEKSGHPVHGWNATKKLIAIYGIASGMAYLHSKGILHRNLKPVTIFMDNSLYPKIHGFNLLIKCDDKSAKKPIKYTPEYMAPEIIMREASTKPMDVYSFAMIVFEIVTLQHPFEEIENLNIIHVLQKVSNNQMPSFKKSIPKSYENLIERCWARNPDDRPSFEEIVHLLKTDKGFITDDVDKEEFYNYIKLIDNQNCNYNHKHDENDKNIINSISNEEKKDHIRLHTQKHICKKGRL